jgi:signal transduction histidine kinase
MEIKGLSMGAVDYITKPFSASLLLKRIEIHLLLESQKRELRFFNENLVADNVALDAASLFRTSAEVYRSINEKQGNVLFIKSEENLPRMYGNADQLICVLSNLLTNANNHTKDGRLSVIIKAKVQQ